MNNWNSNWFLIDLAREYQQRLLREAGLDQALHNARTQNDPTRVPAVRFRRWIAHALGFRTHRRALER